MIKARVSDKYFVTVNDEVHCIADTLDEAKENVQEAVDEGCDLDEIAVYSATKREFSVTEVVTVEIN